MDKEKEFADFLNAVCQGFEQIIPFHRYLDIKIDTFSFDEVKIRFAMKDSLVGNIFQGILHGGVTSAALDIVGGITATFGIIKAMDGCSLDEISERIMKISTIDLRTDYIKPGKGEYFVAKGSILRTGKVVSVARMELYNDQEVLIATGTGTYMAGG